MKYLFGYGSLMNETSLAKTLPGPRVRKPARLYGYQRKVNAPVNGYLYMNLVKNNAMTVGGVLVDVTEQELRLMRHREPGYDMMDVSTQIDIPIDKNIIVFIAPDQKYPDMKIPRSYLETCIRDLPQSDRGKWIEDTLMENEILEDLKKPVYVNAAFKKRRSST